MTQSEDRYAALRQVCRDEKLDALALAPGSNFHRLFGKDFHQNERPLVVIVPESGPPAAVVPNLELGSFALIDFEGEVFDWRDQNGYQSAFDQLARHLPLTRVGVEGQTMRVFVHHALASAYPNLDIVDSHKAISALRVRKNPQEVQALEQAIAISEAALQRTHEQVKAGLTETEVENLLVQNLFANGAQDFSFAPIVAAGDNSARPHAKARADYALQPGDALLIDFGARFDGLCADITRTVFIGHCSDEQHAVYETVFNSNQAGHQFARPGVTAHDVDDTVTSVLEASPYQALIRTKTGHGLGRDVHEDPYIMRGNHTVLENGMVFTIEPGLYKMGAFGVRIEDDVLVSDTGVRSLTQFPRELTIVG